jgi:uncharacterized membrane protein
MSGRNRNRTRDEGRGTDTDEQGRARQRPPKRLMSARRHLTIAMGSGVLVAALAAGFIPAEYWLLAGWDTAAVVYLTTVWVQIWPRTVSETADLAEYTDPTRAAADMLTLVAATASLAAVGVLLIRATQQQGVGELLQIGFGLLSIVLSWAVVHTVFTLRYAHLYYDGQDGGIGFNGGTPRYSDFAYVAFTIGMTFQVSDTDLQTDPIRRTALRHGLLSYVFGTGIVAMTINLVAGLTSR